MNRPRFLGTRVSILVLAAAGIVVALWLAGLAALLIELETAEHERDILRTNTQTLAMMLRKCAHRLKCNGHEDLSADVVGLLRRYGLLGSPLRGTEPEHG